MTPKVITVPPRECPEEVVKEAAQILQRGGLVALPTETVYGVAGLLDDGPGEKRLRNLKSRSKKDKHFTIHLADPTAATLYAKELPWCAKRLAARYWPGSLTLVVPGKNEATVGLRVPSRLFTRTVIGAATRAEHPLVMPSANPPGEAPATTAAEVVEYLGDQVDLVIDGGTAELGESSTVVSAVDPKLEILRAGTLTREEVEATACFTVLFVCSGNTCRSPMAAALAKKEAAKWAQIPLEEYTKSGLRFISAGTGTLPGMPASEGALCAIAELQMDLAAHRSQVLTRALLDQVQLVLCLTTGHRQRAQSLPAGETPPEIDLILPSGKDVIDPFGGDLEIYRATRDSLALALEARIPGLLERPWKLKES